jgi:aromatic-L-amino-acid decarboxylase
MSMDRATLIAKIDELGSVAALALEPTAADRDRFMQQAGAFANHLVGKHDAEFVHTCFATKPAPLPAPSEKPTNDNLTALLNDLEHSVLDAGIDTSSAGYVAYVPGGGVYMSALGDLVAATANRYPGFFPLSPNLVRLENQLISFIAEAIGYAEVDPSTGTCDVGGVLASGGTTATISALVAARDAHEVATGGPEYAAWYHQYGTANRADAPAAPRYLPPTEFVIYTTDQTHSCSSKALAIIGCRMSIYRKVARDAEGRMIIAELRRALEADIAAGLKPFLIIASAGTVNGGAVDDFEGIHEVAKQHSLWFHIDAAYGGLLALCDSGRRALQGLHYADSIVVDPHKALFLPSGTGVVLVRDAKKMLRSHASTGEYLERWTDDPTQRSSADYGLELTKHNRSFRLWLPLAFLGVAPFRACQEEKMMLAQYFWQKLREQRLEQPDGNSISLYETSKSPPTLTIALFRAKAEAIEASGIAADQCAVTRRIAEMVREDGRLALVHTFIDGKLWLRVCILNFRTHRRHIDLLLELLEGSLKSILEQQCGCMCASSTSGVFGATALCCLSCSRGK